MKKTKNEPKWNHKKIKAGISRYGIKQTSNIISKNSNSFILRSARMSLKRKKLLHLNFVIFEHKQQKKMPPLTSASASYTRGKIHTLFWIMKTTRNPRL